MRLIHHWHFIEYSTNLNHYRRALLSICSGHTHTFSVIFFFFVAGYCDDRCDNSRMSSAELSHSLDTEWLDKPQFKHLRPIAAVRPHSIVNINGALAVACIRTNIECEIIISNDVYIFPYIWCSYIVYWPNECQMAADSLTLPLLHGSGGRTTVGCCMNISWAHSACHRPFRRADDW